MNHLALMEVYPMKDYSCPVCDADLSLDGNEKPGDEIYCSYCGCSIRIRAIKGSDDLDLVNDN
jgi:transcription elongation factor Elf1